MNINFIVLIITSCINLFLLFIIVINKKSEINKTVNWSFILSIIFLIIWTLFNYLADSSTDAETALLWTRLTFPAAFLMSWFVMIFSYEFPRTQHPFKKRIIIYLLYLFFLLLFSLISLTNFVINDVNLEHGRGVSGIILGRYYFIIMLAIVLMFINVFYIYYKKYKTLKGIEKIQIIYVIWGWFLFLLGAIITNLILPYFTHDANWSKFGPLFSVLMVAFTVYAIIKHHLFDIRIIIQRSLIYTITFSLVISFYLVLISILGYFFQQSTDATVLISAGLTILLGIYGVQHIERFFQRVTDRIFFKDKYDYQEAIYELSQILNKNIELKVLSQEIIKKLKEIMKVNKAEIYLLEHNVIINEHSVFRKPIVKLSKKDLEIISEFKESIALSSEIPYLIKEFKDEKIKYLLKLALKYAQKNKIAIFSAIRLENRFIGTIMLGEKRSGDIFNSDDFNLLKTFSAQAAIALAKAQLYAKVKNYSRDLERRVKQRTAKIRGLQEEQKQMMLEMAHNLQTPLTIIKGELELLKRDIPDNKNLYRFERSIDKISKFIYDILRLAKLESIENDFEKDSINLSELVNELVEYFEVVTEEKGIKIIKDIEPDIYVLGQKEKIEEMITNIVGNATKYIDEEKEEHKIIIKLYKKRKKAILTIEDNGIGINEKDLPNLFTKFYRSKDARHSEIKGTGLGLVVSKKIAEIHGGDIRVESKVGVGTKFIIELPCKSCKFKRKKCLN